MVAQERFLRELKDRTDLGMGALREMVRELKRETKKKVQQRQRRHRATATKQHSYRATNNGLVLEKSVDGGTVQIPLSNFTATITSILRIDNGKLVVAARNFHSMSWVIEQLGPKAIVYAGFGIKDHVRTAIQVLSPQQAERYVYAHTGWRLIEGHGHCYLHGGGAITSAGLNENIEVQLPAALAPMVLPEPPEGEPRPPREPVSEHGAGSPGSDDVAPDEEAILIPRIDGTDPDPKP